MKIYFKKCLKKRRQEDKENEDKYRLGYSDPRQDPCDRTYELYEILELYENNWRYKKEFKSGR